MKAIALMAALLASIPLTAQSIPKTEPPKSDAQLHAEALMDRAHKLSDIRSNGSPAFRLKATFSFIGKDLAKVEGTYSEVWVSSSQWWRETVVNGQRRVEVGGPNRHWLIDKTIDFPDIARRLSDLLNVFPSSTSKFEFDSINLDSAGMKIAECAITKPDSRGNKYAFCFDDQSGALLEKAAPEIRPKNTTTFSCVYGVFRRFGDFQFPREVSCFEEKHRKIDAKIVELSLEPSPDAELFKPPPGASERIECLGKKTAPFAQSRPDATYPRDRAGIGGAVVLLLVVDRDGKPQELKVVQSVGKDFDDHALAAVGRWKFRPGTCDAEPIPMEISVEIDFHPRY
jgi:TonB family protein